MGCGRATQLNTNAILAALEAGDFYASTGVELTDYQVTTAEIKISIKQDGSSKYRISFIGKGGEILKESIDNPALYQFRGNELYVRAKVIESNGKVAWTQPVWRGR